MPPIEDRISALPDELLQRLLSFLPSKDAVQTCVLGQRWRDQWKTVPALRITDADAKRYECASALNKFVNCLLLFRHQSPLLVAEITSFGSVEDIDDDDATQYLEPWVRYVLLHKAQKLRVCSNKDIPYRWELPHKLITSKHLTKLELVQVETVHDFLDFSSCPKLEDLKMEFCSIFTSWIVSPSLKRLSITCCVFCCNARVQISVPGLISLQLADCNGRTPLLEYMPMLVSAFVRLQHCSEKCQNSYETGNCGDESCEEYYLDSDGGDYSSCLLLDGLSDSTNLELTAAPGVFLFRKDLMWCPEFSKLKTLLLNEWCITANLGALICFLQHSPILEKLTLQFCEIPEELVDRRASYDMTKQWVSLKQLIVEVKCQEVDEKISKILELLCSFGISYEKIEIQQAPKLFEFFPSSLPWTSGSFSFEQKRT